MVMLGWCKSFPVFLQWSLLMAKKAIKSSSDWEITCKGTHKPQDSHLCHISVPYHTNFRMFNSVTQLMVKQRRSKTFSSQHGTPCESENEGDNLFSIVVKRLNENYSGAEQEGIVKAEICLFHSVPTHMEEQNCLTTSDLT